jgi:hypothetical protein
VAADSFTAKSDAETPDTGAPFPEAEAEEVSYESAAAEASAQDEQKKVETAKEEQEDVLDVLVPKAEPRTWSFGPENMQRTYIQKPMSFIGRIQWFALVGEVLDKAMSGPNGMSVNNLFSAPQPGRQLTMEDFRDADTFIQAVGKLMAVAPDFLVKSYCIWLNVPDYDREIVAGLMKLPEDEGGLTQEQGIEIIEVFIDQNYEALRRFFREDLPSLQRRIQAKVRQGAPAQQ